VVGAAEMRGVKAAVAAASVEMTPTTVEMAPAAMATASVTAAAMTTTTAPGQRGARQHGRQNNNGNSRDQF
jgi:Spy/CpxP family protein refolding chaperone